MIPLFCNVLFCLLYRIHLLVCLAMLVYFRLSPPVQLTVLFLQYFLTFAVESYSCLHLVILLLLVVYFWPGIISYPTFPSLFSNELSSRTTYLPKTRSVPTNSKCFNMVIMFLKEKAFNITFSRTYCLERVCFLSRVFFIPSVSFFCLCSKVSAF